MAKLSVTLNDEHITLIKNFYIQKLKSRDLIFPNLRENLNEKIKDLPEEVQKRILTLCAGELKKIRVAPMDDYYGIDTWTLYGGAFLLEDIARILGYYEQVIPESVEDPMGPRFPEELEHHMMELDDYIVSNLIYIEEIIHQHCDEGIKSGTYTCLDRNRIWKYKEEA